MKKALNTLRKAEINPEVSTLQNLLSAHGYFQDSRPSEGIFCDITDIEVKLFQSQHFSQDKTPLSIDGVVGEQTWWALQNPSGEAQKNHLLSQIPQGLTQSRERLLEIIFQEHAKNVHEVPDGSNSSVDIDQYWGTTGLKSLPWCCAFVSWSLQECLGSLPINGRHHVGVISMWRAARQLNLQTKSPKPADIFILDLGRGKGHTGFVVSLSNDGQSLYTCEGNTGNRLKIGKRDKSSINFFIDALQDNQDNDFERKDFDVKAVAHLNTR
ncbi:CHAP domain-containing protein [Aliikangiella sp. IMCC44632]